MTTEKLISAQSNTFTLISNNSDEKLVRSDYDAKNPSGKEDSVSPVRMAPSSSTRKKRAVLSDDEEESVDRNKTSIADDTDDDEEQNGTSEMPKKTSSYSKKKRRLFDSDSEDSDEANETSVTDTNKTGSTLEMVPNKSSSLKKKRHFIHSPEKENVNSKEDSMSRTCTPGISLKNHPTAKTVRRCLPLAGQSQLGTDHCSSEDDFKDCQRQNVHGESVDDICNTLISGDTEGDEINESDSTCFEEKGSPPKRRTTRNSTRVTASAEKLKKEKALAAYRRERQRALSGSNLDKDSDHEDRLLSPKLLTNTCGSDLSTSQEEESEDYESDFIDDNDAQSQELAAFSFYQPSQEEAYEIYVQIVLSSVLDCEFVPSLQDGTDAYFENARKIVHNLLETKKNTVESSRWKKYKEMLQNCHSYESIPLPDTIMDTTCEACRLTRDLSEKIIFYDECDGKKVKVKEFSVGCFCADRGSIYHELHHLDIELEDNCIQKISEVKEANPGISDINIVKYCTDDDVWLEELYERFQKLLGLADDYGKNGKKRLDMISYCRKYKN
ncbi:uncharacterized protein LOC144632653 isoform X2 [Oculina patagonica]